MPTETPVLPACASPDNRFGGLVEDARQSRCLLLRTGSARGSILAKTLKDLLDPAMCTELAAESEGVSGVDLPELPEDTLRWVQAGRLYEGLLRELAGGNRFGFVFCLDSWTACFLKAARDLCADAKWVYVDGAEGRDHPDHERRMEEWIAALPFDYRVSQASVVASIQSSDSATPAAVTDRAAWRWAFAEPDEKLVAVLVDSIEEAHPVFQASAQVSNLRWVILGPDLRTPLDKTRRVHVLGDLPASVQRGILEVVDACVAFSGPVLDSLTKISPDELSLVVPADLEAMARAAHGRVSLLESDSAESLSGAVIQAMGLSRSEDRKIAPVRDFVLYNEWGIGDELLLSAVAREIVRARRDVRLWIRSRYGFRFPGCVECGEPPADATRVEVIYQNAALYGPQHHSPFPGHVVQQMLDKFALDTGIAVQAEDVRPELRVAKGVGRRSRAVVLHSRPNPRLPSKDWGVERWTALCEALHDAGVQLLQVGAADEALLPHVEDHRGMPVGDVPDLVARAGAVVCLVGFLMHAAAATKTPAIVIYGGREHPAIDGYPDQVHLSSEPLSCRGRWGCHLPPDVSCPHGLRCMEGITPRSVAAEVLSLMDSQLSGATS